MTAPRRQRPIAIVAPQFPPAVGGVEMHVARIARELVERGVAVEVITTDRGAARPGAQRHDGFTVRRFRTVWGTGEYFVSPGLAAWLLARADRYRLLHAHSYHSPMPLLAAAAARRHHLPLVITPHYHGGGHTAPARALHLGYRPLGRWALRQAEAVVCVTAQERDILRQDAGVEATAVIPNGVEAVAVEVATRRDPEAVLVVARAERYKRIDRVIDAVRVLPGAFTLTIVTSGPHADAMAREARAALGADRVTVRSGLTPAELAVEYARAGVLASLSEREAFGMVVLEAAAAGCRVLLSDIPAHREISGYLPAGTARFVSGSATADDVARELRAMSTAGPPSRPANIPTWRDAAVQLQAIYDEVAP